MPALFYSGARAIIEAQVALSVKMAHPEGRSRRR